MLDAEIDSVEVLQQGLKDIASWLDEPLCQRLVNLHANDFFTLIPSGDAVTINFEDLAPWCQLPQDWRLWIEHHIDHMHLSLHLIVASAVCHGDISELPSDTPISLIHYIKMCRHFQLKRSPATTSGSMGSLPYRRLGMKPKKEHEVTSLVSLVQDIWPDKPHRPTHAMDLGSGRAHLSRALAYLPLQMHVTAVDSSESQISGAEKLDTLYQKQHPDFKPLLEHRTKAFNSAEDVSSFLSQWQNDPRSSDIQNKDAARRAPVPLVVALHACGDFSVSILQAFAESMPHLSLILVGCCYNLVSPSNLHLSGTAMPALSSAHQMLATQSPKTYSPSSPDALLPMRKLYYRSRLEAELIRLRSSASSDGQATHPARLGRLSDSSFTSYNKFRSAALSKLGFSDCSSTPLPLTIQARTGAEAEEAAFSRFACLWLLRTLLGPVIESYLVLDRYLYIQSRTDGQTKLRPVFDQSTGSLRNMAILLTK